MLSNSPLSSRSCHSRPGFTRQGYCNSSTESSSKSTLEQFEITSSCKGRRSVDRQVGCSDSISLLSHVLDTVLYRRWVPWKRQIRCGDNGRYFFKRMKNVVAKLCLVTIGHKVTLQ